MYSLCNKTKIQESARLQQAYTEMALSNQQSPTAPCMMSFGSTLVMSVGSGTSATPIPRPGDTGSDTSMQPSLLRSTPLVYLSGMIVTFDLSGWYNRNELTEDFYKCSTYLIICSQESVCSFFTCFFGHDFWFGRSIVQSVRLLILSPIKHFPLVRYGTER